MSNISRTSLVEQVTASLREYIDSDEVQVGDKMPGEVALCRKYNVSRTTVREALRLLQALGYVTLIPNRGAFVADKNRSSASGMGVWIADHLTEVSDAFEFRMILEPPAAALAAKRATAEEKYMLLGIHTMFKAEAEKKNLGGIVLYDERFHECIMKASHNSVIIGVNQVICNTIRNYRQQAFTEDKDADLAMDVHEKLVDAITGGNAELASSLMQKHLETNLNLISQFRKKMK